MRANFLLVAASSAALVSEAAAIERPRIYFPRQVTRHLLPRDRSVSPPVVVVSTSTVTVSSAGETVVPSPHNHGAGVSADPSDDAASEIVVSSSETSGLAPAGATAPATAASRGGNFAIHVSAIVIGPGGVIVNPTTSSAGGESTAAAAAGSRTGNGDQPDTQASSNDKSDDKTTKTDRPANNDTPSHDTPDISSSDSDPGSSSSSSSSAGPDDSRGSVSTPSNESSPSPPPPSPSPQELSHAAASSSSSAAAAAAVASTPAPETADTTDPLAPLLGGLLPDDSTTSQLPIDVDVVSTSSAPTATPTDINSGQGELNSPVGNAAEPRPVLVSSSSAAAPPTPEPTLADDGGNGGGLLGGIIGDLTSTPTPTPLSGGDDGDSAPTAGSGSSDGPTTTDADDGLLGGLLTGLLGDPTPTPTPAPAPVAASSSVPAAGNATEPLPLSQGADRVVTSPPAPPPSPTTADDGLLGGLLTGVLGGVVDADSTTPAAPAITPAVAPAANDTNGARVTATPASAADGDGLGGILTNLLGGPTPTSVHAIAIANGTDSAPAKTVSLEDPGLSGIVSGALGGAGSPTTASSSNGTGSDQPATTADSGLGGILTGILGSPTSTISDGLGAILTGILPPANTTAAPTTTTGGSVLPTGNVTETSTSVPTGSSVNSTATTGLATSTAATDLPASTATWGQSTSTGISVPTTSTAATTDFTSGGNRTSVPTTTTGRATTETTTTAGPTSLLTTSHTLPISTETPAVVVPMPPTQQFTSIPATGTITDSQSWLPTSLVAELTMPTSNPTAVLVATSPVSLPSNIPKVITPLSGAAMTQPEGTTLVHIGFLYQMNYQFLITSPVSAAQIFTFLPVALAGDGDVDPSMITMKSLVPCNTQNTLGYIMTEALVWVPTEMVATLQADMRVPNSRLYNNPSEIVRNLTSAIDPTFNILTGQIASTSSGGTGAGSDESDGGSGGGGGQDLSDGGATTATPQEQAKTAGLVVGSICMAGAYGAVMFVMARRYKRRRQSHQRASSVSRISDGSAGLPSPSVGTAAAAGARQSSPDMAQHQQQYAAMGGALLSRDFTSYGAAAAPADQQPGGRDSHGSGRSGRSGAQNSSRTAYISAPVAAENSLGWN